ncbi:MAG: protein kinase domain-containing protein [Phycisphaerales bacterium]
MAPTGDERPAEPAPAAPVPSLLDRAGLIFLDLHDLPPSAQETELARRCDEDAELEKLVRLLLKGCAEPLTAEALAADIRMARDERAAGPSIPGDGRIGNFKVIARLGEGGFGAVYLAEQSEPVKRLVALKVIRMGLGNRRIIARFEQERQSLALMDHPNIARLFDAGETEGGCPYFVMEYCPGKPIDRFCDENKLPIGERLRLFWQVCLAVQHAHTKGIIHRDIKPSNVIVLLHERRPHVKVIDFGIAKAAEGRPEGGALTEQHQVIGTPEYMSPEQAEGSADIDTRTDVYSLGVLLYKLLTGTTPFGGDAYRQRPLNERRRVIRDVDPPSPSARLRETSLGLAEASRLRAVHPASLLSSVRGELDSIVMKALEKDRARRYETVNGLALDVRRYLRGEAVHAVPPSASYRLKKFARRNRGAAGACAAVMLALLAGAVGFAWQAKAARDQRDAAQLAEASAVAERKAAEAAWIAAVRAQTAEAEERKRASDERDRAILAESQSRARARELEAVCAFQAKILGGVTGPRAARIMTTAVTTAFLKHLDAIGTPKGQGIRSAERKAFIEKWRETINPADVARDFLDRAILKPAVQVLDRDFGDQPLVDATLRQVLADRYRELGAFEAATPLQERALSLRRRLLGEGHWMTRESYRATGDLLQAQGKNTEAAAYYKEVVGKRPPMPHWATARALWSDGKLSEAEPHLREEITATRTKLGRDNLNVLRLIDRLGQLLLQQGRIPEAEQCFREATEKAKSLRDEDQPDIIQFTINLSSALLLQQKLEEAEPLCRQALDAARAGHGQEHPTTLLAAINLATLLRERGDHALAVELLTPTEPAARRTFANGPRIPLAALLSELGQARAALGDFAGAEPVLLDAHRLLSVRQPGADGTPAALPGSLAPARALLDLYNAWNASEPSEATASKAAEWRSLVLTIEEPEARRE